MLIKAKDLPIGVPVRGVIHVGAHECEERQAYADVFHLSDDQVIWIDALQEKVDMMRAKYPTLRMYQQCISNVDDAEVVFNVTNNWQSSSFLMLKTHLIHHPTVHNVSQRRVRTLTLNTFFRQHAIPVTDFNFLNMDIQGAELLALQGASEILPAMDYVYLEVNREELYEHTGLIADVERLLQSYGFEQSMMNMTDWGWGDAFYVKK